ncbi:hypothetical protein BGK67_25955 [Streptomyces subrutilus]|uniref:Uncharacterized protein n=1 Tax=Streptomyces subrutilus TaxID=36818 RepID=A0A1E5PXK3_9ACTN|nr:hypothetical protein BGK67_25955 [Streptomyces subrutilus]
MTVTSRAARRSSRPPPVSRTSPGTAVFAEPTRAALTCCEVHSGWRCLTMAAAPATCGVAMEVPDMPWYAYTPRPPAAAAEIPTPGAAISGLRVCWRPAGPRLEKTAVASSRSTAPTVSTLGAQPGEETPTSGLFPGAPSLGCAADGPTAVTARTAAVAAPSVVRDIGRIALPR